MEKAMEYKAAVAAAISAIGVFLGWQGILATVWLCCMALDWISGSASAAMAGEWSSRAARQGAFHKGGMILVVVAACLADIGIGVAVEHLPMGLAWPGAVMPFVVVCHIVTEIGSILENAIKMGAPCPAWLLKLLETARNTADRKEE